MGAKKTEGQPVMCCHLCSYPYSTSALVRLMHWAKRLTYTFELTGGESGRRNDLKLHTMLPCPPYLLYYYQISWKKEQQSSIMKHTNDTHTTFTCTRSKYNCFGCPPPLSIYGTMMGIHTCTLHHIEEYVQWYQL